ncbi:MAG: hypothetical protein KAS63_01620 [Candidatus Heimdallarchaeota archaeon]|nr:hypothetical protein [Candidatus Heimdallarchaeota archaeon]MCK4954033.1 hypothetical protein [Candidatus Heimdallarchaeota archaeon]
MSEREEINVLCIWKPNEKLQNYLKKGLGGFPEVKLIFPPNTDHETFLELATSADIIMGWRPTKDILYAAKKLRLFINPGAGIQHLVSLFREINEERDVALINGHGNSYFTAQHTVALLLALMNKIILHHNWMKDGKWRQGDVQAASFPLRDRKIGFLGYGAVNQKVHRFLSGFDIDFMVFRRDWNKQKIPLPSNVVKYTYEEFHQFLEEIDTLIIAVPLTSKTEGMIKEKELELLGDDGLLVNMARGTVVVEKSLYQALKEKTILGAALDVWYNYQPETDKKGRKFPSKYPFNKLDNVVLSPHRGASPFSDLKRWDEQIENISRFARGEKHFLNVVNLKEEY